MPKLPQNVLTASSAADLRRIAESASGPIVLDFVAKGCPACKADAPAVAELATSCQGVTVVKVDVDQAEKLADDWGVQYMPVLFVAQSAAELEPGKAKKVANAEAAMATLHCPRQKKDSNSDS